MDSYLRRKIQDEGNENIMDAAENNFVHNREMAHFRALKYIIHAYKTIPIAHKNVN